MALKDTAQELQNLIFSGQLLEGFDKFYHPDVVMQENFEEPRQGKAYNREYEEKFLSSLEGFHGGKVTNLAVDEEKQVVFVESWMDVTIKDVGRVKMGQVAAQQWQDGQIIHERFYHA
ncbi:MAG: hypothetical protein CVV27_06105 [Candidatus Melainabacteria bacterium HGW-Melainabacteria-1]|nr:MAG: hypothetical protein CVV27_06105 [Candidatus Melainabacteria bacterium HGW-Melainabacteria-1]